MRRFQVVTVDVFTSRPLEGNPLAVFPDAGGLSDAEMQALAREMNLSETTFVVPRDAGTEKTRGIQVRIFTVREELPFAGHPTLGTALVLRAPGQDEVALDLKVGRIPVRFGEREGHTFGEMSQRDPIMGAVHASAELEQALGLAAGTIDPALPAQTVSTGTAFVVVPVRSLAALRALRVNWDSATPYLENAGAHFCYFVSRETVDPAARLHARMPFYGGDDPATGSAAGCAAAWMVAHGVAASEEEALIEQGLEVARPSRIFVRAHGGSGAPVSQVRVGGHAAVVMRGELTLP